MAATSAPTLEEIQVLLANLPESLPAITPTPALPAHVAGIIDHTLLAPTATPDDVRKVCAEAVALNAATVCVNSSLVGVAAAALQGTPVRPICTIGFPFGASSTAGKVRETLEAVKVGAHEIDMVQNVGLLKAGDYFSVFDDVRAVVQACRPSAKLKVILETCFLSREEIAIATMISCRAGADFVKTSTGYGSGGAKAEDVRLMYHVAQIYGNGAVHVKASGGIRTAAKVQEMVANGARRIGASGTQSIAAELAPMSQAAETTSIPLTKEAPAAAGGSMY